VKNLGLVTLQTPRPQFRIPREHAEIRSGVDATIKPWTMNTTHPSTQGATRKRAVTPIASEAICMSIVGTERVLPG